MKFAIFCCLLSLCAFEFVHTSINSKINEEHGKAKDQMTNFLATKRRKIQHLVDFAKEKKKSTEDCEYKFKESMQTSIQEEQTALQKCVLGARQKKNLDIAKNCSKTYRDDLQKSVGTNVSTAEICISDLLKDRQGDRPKKGS